MSLLGSLNALERILSNCEFPDSDSFVEEIIRIAKSNYSRAWAGFFIDIQYRTETGYLWLTLCRHQKILLNDLLARDANSQSWWWEFFYQIKYALKDRGIILNWKEPEPFFEYLIEKKCKIFPNFSNFNPDLGKSLMDIYIDDIIYYLGGDEKEEIITDFKIPTQQESNCATNPTVTVEEEKKMATKDSKFALMAAMMMMQGQKPETQNPMMNMLPMMLMMDSKDGEKKDSLEIIMLMQMMSGGQDMTKMLPMMMLMGGDQNLNIEEMMIDGMDQNVMVAKMLAAKLGKKFNDDAAILLRTGRIVVPQHMILQVYLSNQTTNELLKTFGSGKNSPTLDSELALESVIKKSK